MSRWAVAVLLLFGCLSTVTMQGLLKRSHLAGIPLSNVAISTKGRDSVTLSKDGIQVFGIKKGISLDKVECNEVGKYAIIGEEGKVAVHPCPVPPFTQVHCKNCPPPTKSFQPNPPKQEPSTLSKISTTAIISPDDVGKEDEISKISDWK